MSESALQIRLKIQHKSLFTTREHLFNIIHSELIVCIHTDASELKQTIDLPPETMSDPLGRIKAP